MISGVTLPRSSVPSRMTVPRRRRVGSVGGSMRFELADDLDLSRVDVRQRHELDGAVGLKHGAP